jgi:hypothetical protein
MRIGKKIKIKKGMNKNKSSSVYARIPSLPVHTRAQEVKKKKLFPSTILALLYCLIFLALLTTRVVVVIIIYRDVPTSKLIHRHRTRARTPSTDVRAMHDR